jgi:hypothetical protein
MSPENFLVLAMTTPGATLSESNGSGMALLFWIGASVAMIGLFGWIGVGRIFRTRLWNRLRVPSKLRQVG